MSGLSGRRCRAYQEASFLDRVRAKSQKLRNMDNEALLDALMSDDPPDGVDNILYRFLFELAESRKRAMVHVPRYDESVYATLIGKRFLDDEPQSGIEERVVREVSVADGGEWRAWTTRIDIEADEPRDYMADTSDFGAMVDLYDEAHPESEQGGWPERSAQDGG